MKKERYLRANAVSQRLPSIVIGINQEQHPIKTKNGTKNLLKDQRLL